ncbi:hypothetical protein L596_013351 [Steinernema carpocapsae]|uniref:Uncharacterized protein n=1 Tax=Steinernema carpocapsae TaxID=34508 RepID=A0A4U5P0R9_STECR|nr:hypothetical protein L596_013351 [Steinernema carpocapsae]
MLKYVFLLSADFDFISAQLLDHFLQLLIVSPLLFQAFVGLVSHAEFLLVLELAKRSRGKEKSIGLWIKPTAGGAIEDFLVGVLRNLDPSLEALLVKNVAAVGGDDGYGGVEPNEADGAVEAFGGHLKGLKVQVTLRRRAYSSKTKVMLR